MNPMRRASSKLLAPCVALLVATSGSLRAQETSRVSVGGESRQGDRRSISCSIAASGRFVAFESEATQLVAGDANDAGDVFVHDRWTRVTSRVSVDSAGGEANSFSGLPAISADGRFVAFLSSATDLVPDDTNGTVDVFVHDRDTGATSRASVDSSGGQANGPSGGAAISADGRFIAFSSAATNLAPGDSNGQPDVFVLDRVSGALLHASVDSAGNPANGPSGEPTLSADGRFVAFASFATNLVAGGTNGRRQIFVHDLQSRRTSLASVDSAGVAGDADSNGPSISADGFTVAFSSAAAHLVPNDTNGREDVFVHDRETGVTSRVSVDSAGVAGNWHSAYASISGDGRCVAFASLAWNLVPGDTNAWRDVFVHDRLTGETTRASVDSAGVQADYNPLLTSHSISADGRLVAFVSEATNLVAEDTNRVADVFVRDRADCRAGNVNGGAGLVVDVLFVNDSAGGTDRTVRLALSEPLTIYMDAPPAGPGPFALYAWLAVPQPGAPPIELPFGIGATCLPTPLAGESPRPRVIWNNTGRPIAGAPTFPSSPAPSVVLQRPRGIPRPATAFLQGIIVDRGAPSGRAAVTNAVTIEVR